MTAIDFPNSPTLNDEFSASDRTWKWDGTTWKTVASTSIAPTAHASSHSSGGTDAVTVAQSQVTNLTASLAAKASLTGVETLTNKTLTAPNFSAAASESLYSTATGFAGYTYYATTNGAVQLLYNASTANGTVNITSTSSQTLDAYLSAGKTMTVTLIIANGPTAYYPTSITVDGSAPYAVKWSGGTAPSSGNANSYDIYTFTLFKFASPAWIVLASVTKFA